MESLTWTPTTRRQHSRDHLSYGSHLSDAEWGSSAPHSPKTKRLARLRRAEIPAHSQPTIPSPAPPDYP
jgi:hypothetical protein